MTPVAILLNLCPECRHGRACAGPEVQPSAEGGITCGSYQPRPNPKAAMTDVHILALPDRDPCSECASLKGTVANRTAHTMADFTTCVQTRQPFLCHGNGHGRVCAGWLRAVKARAAIDDAEIIAEDAA